MSDALPPETTIATWTIPRVSGDPLTIDSAVGEVITVVGANGAGKSALATYIAGQTPTGKLHRVLAQRKIWFAASGPNISASGREQMVNNLNYWNTAIDSRFLDHADGQRTDITLFDLLGKIAAEDQRIAELVLTERRTPEEIEAIIGTRLFDVLNSVLEKAGLVIRVKITDKQTFMAVHRELGNEYPIAQMSDGERSALLLAAEVLVAPDNCIILLDEPERHLHRSISAGLVEALIDSRTDCAFVVLTHDLDLALGLSARPGKVLAALGVNWSENTIAGWDINEFSTEADLTENARRAILGGRKRILFIEGTTDSLDYALYSLLFPAWTLSASGNCEWVIRSVEGIKKTQSHHWVDAAGIVDGDGRSQQERDALITKGIHPIKVSEVESLYYMPAVLTAVATKFTQLDGKDTEQRVCAAKAAGIAALASNQGLHRIAKKLATDEVSRKLVTAVPSEITDPKITFNLPSPYAEIRARLDELHAGDNYEELVRIASIRDSAFRDRVAAALGAQSKEQYQSVARRAIAESPALIAELRLEVADQLFDRSDH
ncbi:AAA family ATPase [Paeniglutamicibacter terrestris]|uniref:AAA family ATPase n=1 Tax=Paeniglutamicibacter terrestris TaxID=2723403 RepID=A0ABX1G8Y5_9MICC|nr:AAA family ATPase [Paeniglutamicibacter terrestris]NKG21995.1 AAA family ATPase [Paeniglutamicibacter terrestris]